MPNQDSPSASTDATLTEYLDGLDRLLDNATEVGRETVALRVHRKAQPKGRTRIGGRSGPLSIGVTAWEHGDCYVAWWRVCDVRTWSKAKRAAGAS